MSSQTGKNFKVQIFGESHADAIGVTVDGIPAGEKIDLCELSAFTARRAPNGSSVSTKRTETDCAEFLCGILNGVTTGAPITAIIRNTNTRSADYNDLMNIPRPSHADYTAKERYGNSCDMRGGGHFSGRLTAPLCIAGGMAMQILARKGIYIGAHIYSLYGISDIPYDMVNIDKKTLLSAGKKSFPTISDCKGKEMTDAIVNAGKSGDSLGGVIECAVIGLNAGVGDPIFDGIENRISSVMFGVPAIKGIEFGNGFASSMLKGSENNDPFMYNDGRIVTKTNNSGGIQGGISNGMPIVFRVAVKPTPSIALVQESIDISKGENTMLSIKGRHDPCILPRAVPAVEAATAIAILDYLV